MELTTEKQVLYFAYGSNMASARLRARVPSARACGIGRLRGHRLTFHLLSGNDGSAKCDACASGREADEVYGVLFSLAASELAILDRFEGLGVAYERVLLGISPERGKPVQAHVYRALAAMPGSLPYDWYKTHVVRGAREHGLPEEYVACLEAVPARTDADAARRARELAIYA
ncbi:gamma-glutamylcyclotransferase family protein [Acidihalobacter prosperus]|uniref:Gamma-glutamylcyclotransferase n=1 Tax=Acidihalobacter prosperus TaxID=160660 RepID=A0A1A6C4E2_9GAMM|nr:gamma-glutamylcyclotransferase family protein [Acidihalobacter prosperus]OBS09437.1 hypothetical protein Thpro_021765 [Acidihalobacter prosperus]